MAVHASQSMPASPCQPPGLVIVLKATMYEHTLKKHHQVTNAIHARIH